VSPETRPVVAVILAAGQGTRMRSRLPKVLHQAAERPLLEWVLRAAQAGGCSRRVVVVGHAAEQVQPRFEGRGVEWVLQEPQLGTGHALAQTREAVGGEARLVVLSGDVPLVTGETLAALLAAAREGFGAMAVAKLEPPGRLGRVVARADGALERIVEASDATPEELELTTVNAGLYVLPAPEIFRYLDRLSTDNAQGEVYLTDALTKAAADGHRLELVELEDPRQAWGVNTHAELAAAHRALVERSLQRLMDQGVAILEPDRTTVGPDVEVGADTLLHPEVNLLGATRVGQGCTLHQGAWLRDSELAEDVVVEPYTVLEGVVVEAGARIGPFARLRPGTLIGAGAKVGNFVEIKNSQLGAAAKANHLAYLGDARVGEGANIGAGAITCNYDGRTKHTTEIGARAFVGSDTLLVAPVRVGEGATTAAGSVITREVPDGALGASRARQKNIPGWQRRRGGAPTAHQVGDCGEDKAPEEARKELREVTEGAVEEKRRGK
jgi:bifunctional UDP-N-acetylglucosamine pyrophosphorylase / glucosamine-1-phosphate N-acetyltransferase